jgi:hypothetical protein
MKVTKRKSEILKERFGIEFQDDDYRICFKQIMSKSYGNNSIGANMILEEILVEWNDFVSGLQNGYDLSSYEFDNDLDNVREPLDLILNNQELMKFKEHEKTQSIISQIDNKFRKLSFEYSNFPNRNKWWERRILLKASNEYYETLNMDGEDLSKIFSDQRIKMI